MQDLRIGLSVNRTEQRHEENSILNKKEIRSNGRRLTKRLTRLADADRFYAEKKREKELVERTNPHCPRNLVS